MLFPPGTAQGSLTGTVAYEGLDVLQDLAKSNKPSRAYYILMWWQETTDTEKEIVPT